MRTATEHDEAVRVRFAPSPTGGLHLGSARTALYNYLFARHHGGRFVVRIEDTDVVRSQARHETSILEDLRWLGLTWDEGPDVGGPYGPYRQSERMGRYLECAEELVERGQAYPCFCPPERLRELRHGQIAAGGTPVYDGRCAALSPAEAGRRRAAGEAAVLRLRVPRRDLAVDDLLRGRVVFSPRAFGDFIIVRSNGVAGYNFAAAVDDRDMHISHVIRGDDHLANTARQLAVFAALGARPPLYAHLSLLLGPDGGKLSKRHGATTVGQLRALGYLPQAVVNYLASLSWAHEGREVLTESSLIAEFELEKLSASPAAFDQDKLDWFNHQHIMRLSDVEHERLVAARLPGGTPAAVVAAVAAATRTSLTRYDAVPRAAAPLLKKPELDDAGRKVVAAARRQLEAFARSRAAAPDWISLQEAGELLARYRAWAKERGIHAKDALLPLRVALTGSEHGSELACIVAGISRTETLRRLAAAGACVTSNGAGEGSLTD